ncbi:MAG TPA: nuclear transport factor 2 family protein [Casimicrobiaceae bacterium]|nr:nuclear transport factor 2 family protein [Casimicrobiaceae bacterium]
MEPSVFESSLQVYFEAFAENMKSQRVILLSRCMTEDGEIWGPQRLFKGYEAISEKIEGFHARMPGARLVLASGLNIFLSIARFKVAIVNSDGSTRSEGDSVIEMADDGRIHKVFPFWEPVPPIPDSWPPHLAL